MGDGQAGLGQGRATLTSVSAKTGFFKGSERCEAGCLGEYGGVHVAAIRTGPT